MQYTTGGYHQKKAAKHFTKKVTNSMSSSTSGPDRAIAPIHSFQLVTTIMVFPVPEHIPGRPVQIDVSSQILNKIDLATNHTLNSSLALEWIGELDQSIHSTKVRLFLVRNQRNDSKQMVASNS